MNCAILGFTEQGKNYHKYILNNPRLKLKYIYDKEVNKVLKEVDDVVVSDRLDLVITDPDLCLVFICTPIEECYFLIKESLTYSKHVLCDTLLSKEENEIKELYDYSYEQKVVLLTGFNKRFEQQINNIKHSLELNKVGNIKNLVSNIKNLYITNPENINNFDFLFNNFYYTIDYVNWLMEDKPISVMITNNKNLKLIMEYKNDSIATINVIDNENILIQGEFGNLNLNKPLEITNSYKMQIEHFLDVIEGEDDIAIWMEACIYPLRIIKTGMKSIERKRKIYINYF